MFSIRFAGKGSTAPGAFLFNAIYLKTHENRLMKNQLFCLFKAAACYLSKTSLVALTISLSVQADVKASEFNQHSGSNLQAQPTFGPKPPISTDNWVQTSRFDQHLG